MDVKTFLLKPIAVTRRLNEPLGCRRLPPHSRPSDVAAICERHSAAGGQGGR